MRHAYQKTTTAAFAAAIALTGSVAFAPSASAQWSTAYEQFYLPGNFNWQFRHNYPAADRLFNAFDFGHAILYETLWTRPTAPISELEEKWYNRLTKEILVHPPRLPLEEAAIEIAYAKLAPEAKMMFDWAHLFHRQVYDVWADERLSVEQKDAKVAELTRYYKSRPDLAFSSFPKTMELMEAQPYSLAFRKGYPKFNGLIWAYHWLQVGLYEPLVVGKNKDERQTGVLATVARFRQMIENPPTNMPRIMPMTAAIAPTFTARYPEAAIIFDNLHSMHDVVSDILANPNVTRNQKRARIMEAARRYRDSSSFVQTVDEWREMAQMMGIENMGGAAVGFLPGFPTPTVERGAVMAGMDHSKMPGMLRDTMSTMDHTKMAGRDSARAPGRDSVPMTSHEKMHPPGVRADSVRPDSMTTMDPQMVQFHMRMLEDPVIRQRIVTDSAMRQMMTAVIQRMPAEHREHMEMMMREKPPAPTPPAARPATAGSRTARPAASGAATKPPATKPAAPKPAAKPAAKDSMPGMDHSKMPGMKKPPPPPKKPPA